MRDHLVPEVILKACPKHTQSQPYLRPSPFEDLKDLPGAKGQNGKKPLKCYKCGGWGHVIWEYSTLTNVNWEELNQVKPATVEINPESKPSKQQ